MPLNADALRHWNFPLLRQSTTDRDTMLYALSIGFGADPVDERERRFVDEQALQAVPTMAATLCNPGPWIADPRTGVTYAALVHGEQRMTFHAPLPPAAALVGQQRVIGIEDKGADRGALVHVERTIRAADTDQLLITIVQTSFCRADGGFGTRFGPTLTPHPLPGRAPDAVVDVPTRADAALLYRLNGDRNPLHSDPAVARRAGFERPILHGLCTYGIGARVIITHLLDADPNRLASLDVRFSSAVYPGETLRIELWQDDTEISYRASVPARGKKVLDNGRATVHGPR